jgi:hypothetical protein
MLTLLSSQNFCQAAPTFANAVTSGIVNIPL